jgi:catechol 2,3-dioxygenase-like lactoylglutathione lyase family enzyme
MVEETPSRSRALMKPRITIITLGVDNLEASLAFYRDGLGLKTDGIESGTVVFFDLESGSKLALYPRTSLARDAGLPATPSSGANFSLSHNVSSRAEVDTVIEQARRASAMIVKEPVDTFWGGYAGYFQDPDQHLWEFAWNPLIQP